MNSVLRFLAKRVLPFIAQNAVLDIDTVEKSDGIYLRVRVEVFSFTIVDYTQKISDLPPGSEIKPIDIYLSNAREKAVRETKIFTLTKN